MHIYEGGLINLQPEYDANITLYPSPYASFCDASTPSHPLKYNLIT